MDIIKLINHFSFGISHILGNVLEWITKSIDRAIEAKKDELLRCRPGALIPNEPKIIWVKCPQRPVPRLPADIPTPLSIEKFNRILEDILSSKRNNYIIDVSAELASSVNFTNSAQLNGQDQDQFWLEVDRKIEAFDYCRASLRPVLSTQVQMSSNMAGRTQPSSTAMQKSPLTTATLNPHHCYH